MLAGPCTAVACSVVPPVLPLEPVEPVLPLELLETLVPVEPELAVLPLVPVVDDAVPFVAVVPLIPVDAVEPGGSPEPESTVRPPLLHPTSPTPATHAASVHHRTVIPASQDT